MFCPERGTVEQLLVTPLNSFEVLFPKVPERQHGIFLKGAGIGILWDSILAILGLACFAHRGLALVAVLSKNSSPAKSHFHCEACQRLATHNLIRLKLVDR